MQCLQQSVTPLALFTSAGRAQSLHSDSVHRRIAQELFALSAVLLVSA